MMPGKGRKPAKKKQEEAQEQEEKRRERWRREQAQRRGEYVCVWGKRGKEKIIKKAPALQAAGAF